MAQKAGFVTLVAFKLTCSTRVSFDVHWMSMKPCGLADLETTAYLQKLSSLLNSYIQERFL